MSQMLHIFFRQQTMQKENTPITAANLSNHRPIILGELYVFYLYVLDLFKNAFNS
jgi:hypothetical protein